MLFINHKTRNVNARKAEAKKQEILSGLSFFLSILALSGESAATMLTGAIYFLLTWITSRLVIYFYDYYYITTSITITLCMVSNQNSPGKKPKSFNLLWVPTLFWPCYCTAALVFRATAEGDSLAQGFKLAHTFSHLG